MMASEAEPLYDTVSGYESSDLEEEEEDNVEMLPELQVQLELITWFHPHLTRHQSDAILQTAEEGVYLMRKRRRAEWGLYSLDVKGRHSVKHFPITLTESGIIMGAKLFQTVPLLMEHFHSVPVLVDESGTYIECKHPYPHAVHEYNEYHRVSCHFLYGNNDSDEEGESDTDKNKVGFSAASKEGYIRKQGAVVKNWKTRWLVLKDNHLAYYPNHKSKKPIRVLLLQEIVHILGDDDTKHFRIVFPWRTFFMEAPTTKNKREWMEILRWKIDELRKKQAEAKKSS